MRPRGGAFSLPTMNPTPTPKTPDTAPRHAGGRLGAKERSDLERRALVAYLQSIKGTEAAPGGTVQARCASKTKTDRQTGGVYQLHFVVIHDGAKPLAVYRVRPVKDYFMLRRLVRWPRGLVAGLNPSN